MKEKFIEVYDNLVPIPIQNYIEDYITSKIPSKKPFPLIYNNQITSNLTTNDIGFSHRFHHHQQFSTEDFLIFSKPLFSLSLNQNILINTILKGRVFLQTPSPHTSTQPPHIDLPDPHWVCLYYVSDSEGDTIFYDNDQKEIKRVSPKKGRIAFFNGLISHSGSKPIEKTRIVINIDFTGEFLK